MMFQIQESCKERKCGCKDHENQKTRRGNRRKWLLEKQFNPNFVYNGIVHFYMDKKGYSKKKANEIAQAIVKREIQRRICKNESCKHFSYDHIRNEEVCLVADCRCREFTK